MKKGSSKVTLSVDQVCDRILEGESLTGIAVEHKVGLATLLNWIEADPERSARVREARARSARIWDQKATDEIAAATNAFELSKAKELAHHYRWRAAKIAPRDYGDRQQVEHSGGVVVRAAEMTDDEIAAYLAAK